MVWFYTRNTEKLTVEFRYDNVTDEFVATVTGLAGPPMTKRFPSPAAFREWIAHLEEDLAAGKWKTDGPPHVLPDGWRDRPWIL
jgi:hypothetical protein